MDHLGTLPFELCHHLLRLLDDKTLRMLRVVNITWFNLIRYSNFTIYFARSKKLASIVKRFARYQWPISLTFTKSIEKQIGTFINKITRLTNLQSLTLTGSEYSYITSFEQLNEVLSPANWESMRTMTSLKEWKILGQVSNDTKKVDLTELVPFQLLLNDYSQNNNFMDAELETDDWEVVMKHSNLTSLHTKSRKAEFYENFTILTQLRHLMTSQITGSTPTTWHFLTALTELTKFGLLENLIGIPREPAPIVPYFNSTRLQVLSFGFSSMPHDLSELTRLTTLTQLVVYSHPRIQDIHPAVFTALINLVTLHVSSCIIRQADMRALTKLKTLSYGSSREKCDIDFTVLPNLEELSGPLHESSAFSQISKLSKLTSLFVNGLKSAADVSVLGTLKLRQMQVYYQPELSEAVWNMIPNITTLETLYCSHAVTDKQIRKLSKLKRLRKLNINDCSAGMTGKYLTRLTSLQELRVQIPEAAKLFEGDKNERKMPYLYSKDFPKRY